MFFNCIIQVYQTGAIKLNKVLAKKKNRKSKKNKKVGENLQKRMIYLLLILTNWEV